MSALGAGYGHMHERLVATERALSVDLDALRKIRLGHPCDVPYVIAEMAVREAEAARVGRKEPLP